MKMNQMEDKDFEQKKPYFALGAHEVYITGHRTGKANSGSQFIEFEVLGANDEVGKTTLWLTEKTVDRTRSILAAIAVHNKDTEAEKQKVRDAFKAITDSDEMLDDKFLAKFKDMQAWILTEEDKNAPMEKGGYFSRNNLYSYEPKPRKTTVDDIMPGATPVSADEVPFE